MAKSHHPDLAMMPPGDMAGQQPDLANPDLAVPQARAAPVWTAVGGGSSVGSATGSLLNMTISGSSVAGAAGATSGASVTFGYFTDDNH
jgi:hypothetical protein